MAHFSKPLVQSKIVGILWMVPIYCVDSWLSLSFKDVALFLDMFRDCYEVRKERDPMKVKEEDPYHHSDSCFSFSHCFQAYVLYLFLALLVAYLGDGDEQKLVELLEQQPRVGR